MSLLTNTFLVCVLCVALYNAHDFQLGATTNATLGYQETVKLSSVPLTQRIKNVFYNSNNTKIIRGIVATDLQKTKAEPSITAGGIGFSFVNVRLKGEKGKALYYLVQVFV
ncbi:hypothetical protein PYW08_014433 [Mythimna loreyi]|uniref:Uncharacterized protein n=1 Tax=Mythimna loreyi TaxID=667449 RepID=A0ACC2R2W2_9NEOP|nr:hypothetical protein PYW08_014433 [Mythimna loreyi]